MGGVLFIDEAYYLYRPENERDYGQEAIEILLQVMENQRDDLVVIFAGYAERMDKFFRANPGFRSRIAHHIDFPDYSDEELMSIAEMMLTSLSYHFDATARSLSAITLRRDANSRISPTRVRSATPSTGCGCARPTPIRAPRPCHARRSDDDLCAGCACQPRVQPERDGAELTAPSRLKHQRTDFIQLEDVVHSFTMPCVALQSARRT